MTLLLFDTEENISLKRVDTTFQEITWAFLGVTFRHIKLKQPLRGCARKKLSLKFENIKGDELYIHNNKNIDKPLRDILSIFYYSHNIPIIFLLTFGPKSLKTQGLTSGEWGCALDNGPKLTVGHKNSS